MPSLRDTLSEALMITGFVFAMMLLIEYLNVQTRGWWQEGLRRSRWRQYAVASALGALPGCLGSFTVVSLYAHGAVSFGALVGTMVASTGDESFVMLAMFPRQALFLAAGLLLAGWSVAFLTDRYLSRLGPTISDIHHFHVHEADTCSCFDGATILRQLRQITFARALLMGTLLLFLFGLGTGTVGPEGWDWVRVTMLASGAFAFFVVTTVPDHFLEEHLWEHVLKRHLLRIFAWTLGALLAIELVNVFLDVEGWIAGNPLTVLLVAGLVGLLPESGPHLAFVSLYAQGLLPLGVLVTSSIVQDGHGTIPLLAVSKKAWVALKLINFVVGMLAGGVILFAVG